MGIIKLVVILVLIAIAIGLLVTNIRIVPQARAYVVERLGAYHGTWQVGLHFKVPLIDKISRKVSLKEKVIDFPPQPVITKDNVTMEIDTVIYFQITDPKLYTYGVESPMDAIENLTATTLRNIIGELELDESLTSREHINSKIRLVLDEATDPWGIKINRVISFTFAVGSALAAIGSVLYFIPRSSVYPLAGSLPGLKCFVAAVFGGIGSIPGALVGGFLIGLCETFIKGSAYSEFSDVFTFVVLILVLLVRPTGLFGEKLKEKV